MNCPKCKSSRIKVLEKRNVEGEQTIRRRRECEECNSRFTTYERAEVALLTVLKKDGSRESFSEEKLRAGLERALEKRPISDIQIESFIEEIEMTLRSGGQGEVKSSEIGDMVLKKLKALDDIAYLRFASVYKSFKDVESFKRELEKIS